jgi:hypothetical protein
LAVEIGVSAMSMMALQRARRLALRAFSRRKPWLSWALERPNWAEMWFIVTAGVGDGVALGLEARRVGDGCGSVSDDANLQLPQTAPATMSLEKSELKAFSGPSTALEDGDGGGGRSVDHQTGTIGVAR